LDLLEHLKTKCNLAVALLVRTQWQLERKVDLGPHQTDLDEAQTEKCRGEWAEAVRLCTEAARVEALAWESDPALAATARAGLTAQCETTTIALYRRTSLAHWRDFEGANVKTVADVLNTLVRAAELIAACQARFEWSRCGELELHANSVGIVKFMTVVFHRLSVLYFASKTAHPHNSGQRMASSALFSAQKTLAATAHLGRRLYSVSMALQMIWTERQPRTLYDAVAIAQRTLHGLSSPLKQYPDPVATVDLHSKLHALCEDGCTPARQSALTASAKGIQQHLHHDDANILNNALLPVFRTFPRFIVDATEFIAVKMQSKSVPTAALDDALAFEAAVPLVMLPVGLQGYADTAMQNARADANLNRNRRRQIADAHSRRELLLSKWARRDIAVDTIRKWRADAGLQEWEGEPLAEIAIAYPGQAVLVALADHDQRELKAQAKVDRIVTFHPRAPTPACSEAAEFPPNDAPCRVSLTPILFDTPQYHQFGLCVTADHAPVSQHSVMVQLMPSADADKATRRFKELQRTSAGTVIDPHPSRVRTDDPLHLLRTASHAMQLGRVRLPLNKDCYPMMGKNEFGEEEFHQLSYDVSRTARRRIHSGTEYQTVMVAPLLPQSHVALIRTRLYSTMVANLLQVDKEPTPDTRKAIAKAFTTDTSVLTVVRREVMRRPMSKRKTLNPPGGTTPTLSMAELVLATPAGFQAYPEWLRAQVTANLSNLGPPVDPRTVDILNAFVAPVAVHATGPNSELLQCFAANLPRIRFRPADWMHSYGGRKTDPRTDPRTNDETAKDKALHHREFAASRTSLHWAHSMFADQRRIHHAQATHAFLPGRVSFRQTSIDVANVNTAELTSVFIRKQDLNHWHIREAAKKLRRHLYRYQTDASERVAVDRLVRYICSLHAVTTRQEVPLDSPFTTSAEDVGLDPLLRQIMAGVTAHRSLDTRNLLVSAVGWLGMWLEYSKTTPTEAVLQEVADAAKALRALVPSIELQQVLKLTLQRVYTMQLYTAQMADVTVGTDAPSLARWKASLAGELAQLRDAEAVLGRVAECIGNLQPGVRHLCKVARWVQGDQLRCLDSPGHSRLATEGVDALNSIYNGLQCLTDALACLRTTRLAHQTTDFATTPTVTAAPACAPPPPSLRMSSRQRRNTRIGVTSQWGTVYAAQAPPSEPEARAVGGLHGTDPATGRARHVACLSESAHTAFTQEVDYLRTVCVSSNVPPSKRGAPIKKAHRPPSIPLATYEGPSTASVLARAVVNDFVYTLRVHDEPVDASIVQILYNAIVDIDVNVGHGTVVQTGTDNLVFLQTELKRTGHQAPRCNRH
jgi:hypothetical protein